MFYDPATDTVDLFVNGTEQISDFPGNTVDPGYATQINASAAGIFGSGSSPGVAKTNYGDVQLTIRNTNCATVNSSCQNFTYPTNKDNYTYGSATGYIPGDATSATQFCTSK